MKRMQCSKISDAKFTTFCSTQEHLMILIYKVAHSHFFGGNMNFVMESLQQVLTQRQDRQLYEITK